MSELRILQGEREIGGNCIVFEDRKDLPLYLDQGLRFPLYNKFYSSRIVPLGVDELRSLRIIPPIDVGKVFISHFHFDHIGLLFNIPPDSVVYIDPFIQNFSLYYQNKNDFIGMSTVFRPGVELKYIEPYKDYEGVVPIPVDHSIFPAYAFYVDNSILYTGDLRVDSPLKYVDERLYKRFRKENLFEYAQIRGLEVDTLIIEGTNFSDVTTHKKAIDVVNTFNDLLSEGRMVFVSPDAFDLDTLLLVFELAKLNNRKVLSVSKKIPYFIDYLQNNFGYTPSNYKDVTESAEIELDLALDYPSGYVIMSTPEEVMYYLRKLRKQEMEGSYMVFFTSEHSSEGEENVEPLARWMVKYNIQPYRLRYSGHYYPHELKNILEVLNPKKIIPIHTNYPELVEAFIKKYKGVW